MQKRSILAAAIAVVLVAALAVGGTLAYFTDAKSATNVFTVGKVGIRLQENFEQGSVLLPATGSAENGTLQNGVTKEVAVQTEEGSEAAYVRVHIAIPQILDEGGGTLDAGENVLHLSYADDSVGAGKWNWSTTAGAPYVGGCRYTTTMDNIPYNVYVVTYETALKSGEQTPENAIYQVYLDSAVTGADIEKINGVLGDEWQIKVVAEGVQAEGFDDAYTALNTAFGTPGAEGYVSPFSK